MTTKSDLFNLFLYYKLNCGGHRYGYKYRREGTAVWFQ